MILLEDIADAIASIRKSSGDMDMVVLCGAVAHAQLGGIRSISGVPVRMDRAAPIDYWRLQLRGMIPKEDWDHAVWGDGGAASGAGAAEVVARQQAAIQYLSEKVPTNPACPICGATDHEKITTAMGTFIGCPQQSKYSVVMSPQPAKVKVDFTPIAEETAESAAPADTIEELARDIWEAGNEFRRAAERESAHELYVYECFALLSARGQDAGFTGPERRRVLSPEDEIVARAEWSRQLRDLQAETRRKEREQVVLDLDWEP